MDNRTQFNNNSRFKEFYGIQLRFSSVAYPRTNGLTKVTNRAILEVLKKRVIRAKGTLVDELLGILCASHTTPKIGSSESSFSLAFGTEVIIPPEIVFPTPLVENFDAISKGLWAELDLISEVRAEAHL